MEKTLKLTAADKTIVDWQSFTILNDEIVNISLPGKKSAMLNRVLSKDPSQLLGKLSSNGQIFLINPNGIVVGKDAYINCNEFIVSTLNLDNDSFIQGDSLSFEGSSNGSILVNGVIECEGNIFFIGKDIGSYGTLKSATGEVHAVAGSSVLIQGADSKEIFIRKPVDSPHIDMKGVIEAVKVELHAHGNDPYSLAINSEGIIRATTLEEKNGRIILKAEGGTVKLGGSYEADSGSVVATGDHVQLASNTKFDVSGDKGGGTISLGGGWKGEDTSIINASTVTIGKDVILSANARVDGDGGTVVVWSDQTTKIDGLQIPVSDQTTKIEGLLISAKGAGLEGKGGKLEVSSKGYVEGLDYIVPDLTAPSGKNGSILFDPTSITVTANTSPPYNYNCAGGGDYPGPPALDTASSLPGCNSLISNTSVQGFLQTGNVTLAATTLITIVSPITPASGSGSLSLQAPTVDLNAAITLQPLGVLSGSTSGPTTTTVVNVGANGTVQNGVDVVASTGTVILAATTYQEAVKITKPLTLTGQGMGSTIIETPTMLATNSFVFNTSPAITYFPIIMADGITGGVNINNLEVNGLNLIGGSSLQTDGYVGIAYHNTSGVIDHVLVTNIYNRTELGYQTVYGILAAVDSGTSNVIVSNSTINNFQKKGISMEGTSGLTFNIFNNTITGNPSTPPMQDAAPNGIESEGNVAPNGPSGTIFNNTITSMKHLGILTDASCILTAFSGPITINQNTCSNSNNGIASENAVDTVTITNNNVSTMDQIGIYVQDTTNLSTVTSNFVTTSGDILFAAVTFLDTSGTNPPVHMALNTITGITNDAMQVLGTGVAGPVVSMNQDSFSNIGGNYISMTNVTQLEGTPNDIWPSTSTVSFDGRVDNIESTSITYAQYLSIRTQIFDKINSPPLGLVLDFHFPPTPPPTPAPATAHRHNVRKFFPYFPLVERQFPRPLKADWAYSITYKESDNASLEYKNGLLKPYDYLFINQDPATEKEDL